MQAKVFCGTNLSCVATRAVLSGGNNVLGSICKLGSCCVDVLGAIARRGKSNCNLIFLYAAFRRWMPFVIQDQRVKKRRTDHGELENAGKVHDDSGERQTGKENDEI